MGTVYLNKEAEMILHILKRPGQTNSGVIIEHLSSKADAYAEGK